MNKVILEIEGMNCNHCVMAVKMALQSIGIQNPIVEIGKAEIEYDESKLSQIDLVKSIEEEGYKVKSSLLND
ncbi:MAG: cation transporter [Ignavibacteria bacterium]|nr:cation transporter [Ignavibacteria bacterium]